jgi:hypothetical protein
MKKEATKTERLLGFFSNVSLVVTIITLVMKIKYLREVQKQHQEEISE